MDSNYYITNEPDNGLTCPVPALCNSIRMQMHKRSPALTAYIKFEPSRPPLIWSRENSGILKYPLAIWFNRRTSLILVGIPRGVFEVCPVLLKRTSSDIRSQTWVATILHKHLPTPSQKPNVDLYSFAAARASITITINRLSWAATQWAPFSVASGSIHKTWDLETL